MAVNIPAIPFGDAPEQVLVTGATGFIGQRLVRSLLLAGHHVTVLTRNPQAAAARLGRQVAYIAELAELSPATRIDVIINLAGARILGWRWTARRKEVLRHSRVALSQKVVAWIATAEHKPRLLLSASAIGYYGIQPQGDDRFLNESSPPQPIFMSQLCQEWEAAVAAASQYGVHVVCMRFGVVFGEQGALPMMLLPYKLGMGGRLGRGNQWQSWIHIVDLLRGMAHLWRSPTATASFEAYNFTAPESVTQAQFSKVAGQVLHRPSCLPTPAWSVRLALGEQADLLLEGQRVAPVRLLEEGFIFDYPDLRSALRSVC